MPISKSTSSCGEAVSAARQSLLKQADSSPEFGEALEASAKQFQFVRLSAVPRRGYGERGENARHQQMRVSQSLPALRNMALQKPASPRDRGF